MTRPRVAEIIAYVGAAMVLGTAAWHQSGYAWVTTLAAEGSPTLKPLMAALWVYFALALVLTAGLVLLVARVGAPNRAAILSMAALTPVAGAAVQLGYLGFMPPTALLLVDALVILIAAVVGHAPHRVSAPAA